MYSKGDRKQLGWTLGFSQSFITNRRKPHVASARRLVEPTAGWREKSAVSGAAPSGALPRPAPLRQPGSTGLSGHSLAGSFPAATLCQCWASTQSRAAFVSP